MRTLGRFQTKAQDLDVDDHEVKVSTQIIIFPSWFYLRIENFKFLTISIRRTESLKVTILLKGKYKLPSDESTAFVRISLKS